MMRLEKQLIILEEKNLAPGLFRCAAEIGSHPNEILRIDPEDYDIPIVLQVAHRLDLLGSGNHGHLVFALLNKVLTREFELDYSRAN